MKKRILLIKLICIIGTLLTFLNPNISNANDLRWDLYFENIRITEGSIPANQDATIVGPSHAEITFDVTLQVPGDYYEFTVDVINNGTVDAMISQVGIDGLSATQEKYISYEVRYSDGMIVNINDKLKAGTRENLRVLLKYKEEISPNDLPAATSSMTLSLNTSYVQADKNAVDRHDRDNGNTNTNTNTNQNSTQNNYYNEVNNYYNEVNNYYNVVNNNDGTVSYVSDSSSGDVYINKSNSNKNGDSSTQSNNRVSKIIRNVATGDGIVKYGIILALATVAFILSFWKKNH